MFDSRPTRCNCGGTVVYGKMEKFGLRPYQSGYCYICQKCGAYVGTHQNRPKDALGILAAGDTRRLRVLCHEEFDKHWMSTAGKSRVYYRLSKEMGIKKEDCHTNHLVQQPVLYSGHSASLNPVSTISPSISSGRFTSIPSEASSSICSSSLI